ncbi:MAG: isocitrate dehydrogenase [Sandaracinus sp.]|nr:isocitrate dehydrogenase [Sandaracinus sp.]
MLAAPGARRAIPQENRRKVTVTTHKTVLIPGDGIGPEVADAVREIFEAADAPIEWEVHHAGLAAVDAGDELLPPATLDAVREHRVALKGPCTTPVGKGFRSVNVQLRKELDLYASVRPVRTLPGIETRYSDVDLVVLRENTEGLYAGIENEVTPGVVTSIKVVTERASKRFAKWGFEYCRLRGRERITAMHKANIMKLGDGLFIRSARQVHEEGGYGDVAYDEMIIDAGAMRLVQNPHDFDVLLLQNLYGDVFSDLCAGFIGGLGVAPGANIGDDRAIFEAVHGSAPDIAGKGIANPLSLLMSGVMMLQHMGEKLGAAGCKEAAAMIEAAYERALSDGQKTGDIGGSLNTAGFTKAVIERL